MRRGSWTKARKAAATVVAAVGSAFALTHVEKVERSDRRRFMFLSPEYERRLGERALERVVNNYRVLPPTHPSSVAVARIGQQIEQALRDQQLKWRFQVVESWERDVVCLPGGKVVVHSGILDALGDDDDALAAVLFHEAAHGYLRHGSEKVSLSLLAAGVLLFLVLEFGVFFFFYPGAGPVGDLMTRLSTGLPNTRRQEREADELALHLMAQACFDPRVSAELHKVMNTNPSGRLGFVPKHGIDSERMGRLSEPLRQAIDVFESSDCAARRGEFKTAIDKFPSYDW